MSTEKSKKIILQCKLNNGKQKNIAITQDLIDKSHVLQNALNFSVPNEPISLPIDAEALQNIMKYLTTFSSEDIEFDKTYFDAMSKEALFAFVKAVDYLDMDLLRVNIGNYLINYKINTMTSSEMSEYLGIKCDYSADEQASQNLNGAAFYLNKFKP